MSCLSPASPKKRLKSQVEDDDDDDHDSCGICFAERGAFVAGEIDCCSHYFCFVCIMEWAKHESRCPICRQRFSNIRRPPMLGLFPSSRDVNVPCRDQGYHPDGNITAGPVGSNAEAKCSVCLIESHENLLLVCDLCSTVSHSFCTGLGFTVPEGDWFCNDCATARESVTSANEESEQQNVSSVTISDIVRGPSRSNLVDRRSVISSSQQNQSSPAPVISLPDRVSGFNANIPVSRVELAKHRVQAIRANWNALRTGALRFHGNSAQSGGTASEKQESGSLSGGKLNVSPSMSSGSRVLQQSAVQGGPSSNGLNDRGMNDVEKAWKMMDRAKMKQQTHQRTSSIPQRVGNPSRSGAREMSLSHFDCPASENQQLRKLDSRHTRMDKKREYSSLNKNLGNHKYPKSGEKRQSRVETMQHMKDRTNSEGYGERPVPKMVHAGMQGVSCHAYEERNGANEPRRFGCLVTSEGSAPSHCKLGSVIANNDVDIFNEEKRLTKTFGEGNTRNLEEAKDEIKSLVKTNLKFLTKDKKLGVETFKIVARQATHTILAACSSKQQNSNMYSSSSICSHRDHNQQLKKSTLMPNCCSQCFDVFVNNTVNSILLEKVGRA